MQLSPKANADTIHRVHRILAQRYHPDTPDTGNAEMFIRVTAAARILSDPEQRAKYDARYHARSNCSGRFLTRPRRRKDRRRRGPSGAGFWGCSMPRPFTIRNAGP